MRAYERVINIEM